MSGAGPVESSPGAAHADALHAYPVTVCQPVQWGDMDAYQHVNNTVYLRWFETGRAAYFDRAGLWVRGAPTGIAPIFAQVQCRYRAPVTFPDTVDIGVRVVDVGIDRFTVHHAVYSRALARIAAEGEGIIVSYDYGAGRKAPLPQAWRDAMARVEGRSWPAPTT